MAYMLCAYRTEARVLVKGVRADFCTLCMLIGEIMAMPSYTADDGLRLLMYLGLEFDLRAQVVFRRRFDQLYSTDQRYDFIGTCHEVYAACLFCCKGS